MKWLLGGSEAGANESAAYPDRAGIARLGGADDTAEAVAAPVIAARHLRRRGGVGRERPGWGTAVR